MSSDHVLAADIKKALPVSNPEGPCTNFTNNKNIHLLPCKITTMGKPGLVNTSILSKSAGKALMPSSRLHIVVVAWQGRK